MDESDVKGREDELNDEEELSDPDDDGTVVLIDSDGNEVTFGILGFVEESEQMFALLSPVEQLENEEDDNFDVFIFRYTELEDGSEEFSEVEDAELFERVRAQADAMLVQLGDDEEEEGEEGEAHDHEHDHSQHN
ncbi:MAG: DUF1292 domain-containing protein [Deltaproteobacteria bacterium]|nr:DUF1292 domain-containing protein [Deltaproteobacteria bacterium]MBK9368564.1 DUF1292 domain-containing protein [Deltaproteobacteria bacterium]MBK9648563.1 DUF1292 domain-containing protein [Deltaproteobacteria bacterium]